MKISFSKIFLFLSILLNTRLINCQSVEQVNAKAYSSGKTGAAAITTTTTAAPATPVEAFDKNIVKWHNIKIAMKHIYNVFCQDENFKKTKDFYQCRFTDSQRNSTSHSKCLKNIYGRKFTPKIMRNSDCDTYTKKIENEIKYKRCMNEQAKVNDVPAPNVVWFQTSTFTFANFKHPMQNDLLDDMKKDIDNYKAAIQCAGKLLNIEQPYDY